MKTRSLPHCLLALAWLLGAALHASAATLVVTNLADSGPGTLRQAIIFANSNADADVITFDAALSGKTNILTSGQLTISNALTIDASALPAGFKISGNHNSRVFEATAAGAVTLNSLTIQDGYIPGSGGGGIYSHGGGGLTITNCTIADNSAGIAGGISAITLTINSSTVSRNSAVGYAGGVDIVQLSQLELNNSTIVGNSASEGGGIYGERGAILEINNSTLSGNSASSRGGGVSLLFGCVYPTNSIVAGNVAPSGSNVVGSVYGANNLIEVDPLLEPLGNYGGPTSTMRPRPGSPAINAGTDSVTNSLATDQRGYARRFGAHVDIGAVEAQLTVVSNLNDSGPGSLRAAIADPPEMIGFATSLSGGTLTLTSGQIEIGGNLTIDAHGNGITVAGNHNSRIFEVSAGATVTLDSLTITGGKADSGGGIFVDSGGTLTLRQTTLYGNWATNNGGGIVSYGTLTLRDSDVSTNIAASNSGGIENDGGTLTVIGCRVHDNSASYGGGIASYFANAVVVIAQSTIFSNWATNNGGGIENAYGSTLTLNNSTFSANSAGSAGGSIETYLAALTANNSTISSNSAAYGGGINNYGALFLTNTIVAGNNAGTDPNISTGGTGSFSGANNLTNGNPLLAPLGDYGGPTLTMRPLGGSPVIDAGTDSVTNFLATDQRGYPRLSSAHVDIGAVEAQVVSAAKAPVLTKPVMQTNGAVLVGFASSPNADFTILASTNVALPLGQWSLLGFAAQYQPGGYHFTDPNAVNYSRRFYRVTSP